MSSALHCISRNVLHVHLRVRCRYIFIFLTYHRTDVNGTWQEANKQLHLPSVLRPDWKTNKGVLASDLSTTKVVHLYVVLWCTIQDSFGLLFLQPFVLGFGVFWRGTRYHTHTNIGICQAIPDAVYMAPSTKLSGILHEIVFNHNEISMTFSAQAKFGGKGGTYIIMSQENVLKIRQSKRKK